MSKKLPKPPPSEPVPDVELFDWKKHVLSFEENDASFLIFAGSRYYPSGGASDFVKIVGTAKDAIDTAEYVFGQLEKEKAGYSYTEAWVQIAVLREGVIFLVCMKLSGYEWDTECGLWGEGINKNHA